MKAAQINTYGGSDVVEITHGAAKPAAPAEGLLVQVYAAGVNPVDWKIREGYLKKMVPLQFPATLGGDFSGVVIDVGDGVADFNPGDEVYGQAIIVGGGSGSFAEFATTNAGSAAQKPKTVSHTEAAALPLAGVSALQALTEHMQLSGGHKILIHGGAGGIGTMAIQLAKHLGAEVATTATAAEKHYVQQLGAAEIIDYQNQRFEDVVKDFDAVFDTVGGETYERSFRVLKRGGIIVSMVEQTRGDLMERYGVTAVAQATRVTSERLTQLADLVDQRAVTVHLDKLFSLEQAGEALAYLQTGQPHGKVVLQIKE